MHHDFCFARARAFDRRLPTVIEGLIRQAMRREKADFKSLDDSEAGWSSQLNRFDFAIGPHQRNSLQAAHVSTKPARIIPLRTRFAAELNGAGFAKYCASQLRQWIRNSP